MLVQNESRARIEQNVLSHATKRTFAAFETYFRGLRNVLSSAALLSVGYNGKIVRLCIPLILCCKRKNFTPSLADLSNIFWRDAHSRDYMIRLVPLHSG